MTGREEGGSHYCPDQRIPDVSDIPVAKIMS